MKHMELSDIARYAAYLQEQERSAATVEKYTRALERFYAWLPKEKTVDKRLCAYAGVPESRVFLHNLRHLFARVFYRAQRDIAKLADVLGHSSIETTRIYLLSSGQEHQAVLDRLQLIC